MKKDTKKKKKDIQFIEDILKAKGECMDLTYRSFINDRCPNCPVVPECVRLSQYDQNAFLEAITVKLEELKNGK